jgi:hypothetical protein
MTLLTATEITAYATAVLAFGAIFTGVFAFLAFGKQRAALQAQSAALEAQRKQLDDQHNELELHRKQFDNEQGDRRRVQERERRAQAAMISGWSESIRPGAAMRKLHVLNMSDEPVYNINIFLENEDQQDQDGNVIEKPIAPHAINKRFVHTLPPNQHICWEIARKDPASEGPKSVPRAALFFNDKNDVRWLRDWDGRLKEAEKDNPEDHRAKKPSDDVTPPERKFI